MNNIYIYREIGKILPKVFRDVFYCPLNERYYYLAGILETSEDSYRIESSDYRLKEIVHNLLSGEPRNCLKKMMTCTNFDIGEQYEELRLTHVSNEKFSGALMWEIIMIDHDYTYSPIGRHDLRMTPVSSVEEAEEIHRNFVPPGLILKMREVEERKRKLIKADTLDMTSLNDLMWGWGKGG